MREVQGETFLSSCLFLDWAQPVRLVLEEVRGTGFVTWKCRWRGKLYCLRAQGSQQQSVDVQEGGKQASRQWRFLRVACGFLECCLSKASWAVFGVSGRECYDLGSMSAVGLREMSQLGWGPGTRSPKCDVSAVTWFALGTLAGKRESFIEEPQIRYS